MPPWKIALRFSSRCCGVMVAATPRARALDELHGFARGHVLEHDAQPRKAFDDSRQHAIDEDALAIEDVDVARP